MSNFTLLNLSLPEVATLVAAMVQARDAVDSRSWSHPQEPTTEEWWADVLADPRARIQKRRSSEGQSSARSIGSPTSRAK
jgi:hypothetical protein